MRTAEELRRAKLIKMLPIPENENHSRARSTLFQNIMRLEFAEHFVSLNEIHQDVLLQLTPLDLQSLANTNQCLDYMVQEAQLLGYTVQKLDDQPGIRIFNPIPTP
jgi:hypothetical protein